MADQIPSTCGDGDTDPGEVCDGQPGCQPGICQPLPGYRCGLGPMGETICYRLFPIGYPSHAGVIAVEPVHLIVAALDCSMVVNTDTVSETTILCNQTIQTRVVTQDRGPELAVFLVHALNLTGSLRFTGNRVPVFMVYGDSTISNTAVIDVGANAELPGPGGQFMCGLSVGGGGPGNQDCGGGGGGFGDLSINQLPPP